MCSAAAVGYGGCSTQQPAVCCRELVLKHPPKLGGGTHWSGSESSKGKAFWVGTSPVRDLGKQGEDYCNTVQTSNFNQKAVSAYKKGIKLMQRIKQAQQQDLLLEQSQGHWGQI